MSREDQEAQEDELVALTNIYPKEEFKRQDATQGGEIHLCLDLPSDFVISIKNNSATNSVAENFENTVSFLPSIVLNFEFPPDYPSTAPPDFTLSCKWLSPTQLTLLCQHLDGLWEQKRGCVILFPWIQFLKEKTLDYLNIKSPYEIEVPSNGQQNWMQPPEKNPADGVLLERGSFDKRAIQDVQSVSALVNCIIVFSEAQEKKVFDSKQFLCDICFMEKLGSECTHFKECQHVYCNCCLKDYFEIQIKDGQVHSLICPEPKCTSVATPAQVKDLVGEQLFCRYDRLLLQSGLDLMADILLCPRPSCQTPVMLETGGAMGICTVCQYAFCGYCKKAFHGITGCTVNTEKLAELIKEHQAADKKGKRLLEERFEQLKKAIQQIKNVEWLGENSKPCPSCKAPIQKIDGCNKMTCYRCKKNFCWICLMILTDENPYDHFNGSTQCRLNR